MSLPWWPNCNARTMGFKAVETVNRCKPRDQSPQRHRLRYLTASSDRLRVDKAGAQHQFVCSLTKLGYCSRQGSWGKRKVKVAHATPRPHRPGSNGCPTQKGLSPKILADGLQSCYRLCQLPVDPGLAALASGAAPQVASSRARMAASRMPSARASQVLTSARSRPTVGISFAHRRQCVEVFHRSPANHGSTSPASITRQGTLPSGWWRRCWSWPTTRPPAT